MSNSIMLKQDEGFLKDSYQKAIVPCMLSILGGTINILVDGILVGQKIGSDGLAAINLSLPVYLVLCIIGSFLVSGTAITASELIGKNQVDEAQEMYHTSITSCCIASMVITVIGMIFLNPLVSVLSADRALAGMVEIYSGITLIGALPKILVYIPFWFLRLDGRNKSVTLIMIIMAVGNIVLDFVSLYGLNMGIAGVAWASVIATAAACAVGFYILCDKRSNFRFGLKSVRDKEHWRTISRAGSPSAMNNVFQTLRIMTVNFLFLQYGDTSYIAEFTAINCISAISLCIIDGVPQAATAMLGIYYGEHDSSSSRLLLKYQWRRGAIYALVFAIIIVLGANYITTLYGLKYSLQVAMIALAVSLFPSLLNSILTTYYNVSGHVILANIIIMSRTFLFSMIALAILLRFNIDPWWFYIYGEVATSVLWLIVTGMYHNKHPQLSRYLLLDFALEESGKVLNFSVQGDPDKVCEASSLISDFCEDNGMVPKQIMRISLALEEIMIMILDINKEGKVVFDVRAFSLKNEIGIRIRYNGAEYNPFQIDNKDMSDEQKEQYIGIDMIRGMAQKIVYQRTFGTNYLRIEL